MFLSQVVLAAAQSRDRQTRLLLGGASWEELSGCQDWKYLSVSWGSRVSVWGSRERAPGGLGLG